MTSGLKVSVVADEYAAGTLRTPTPPTARAMAARLDTNGFTEILV
jgi:hypothetical protein